MPTRPSAVLVGRDPELGRLREALGGPGDGGAVLLGGDAGIGKSAVVARLVDETTTRRVLLGHCVGDVGTLPYLPFVEMLAALDGRERDLVDELVEAHPGLVPLVPRLSASARETARADLVEAVHAVLGVLGREGGALVVVEDAHWADESTRELLTLLFTRGAPEGVSLVVTYRSDDVHRRHPLAPALAVWSRLPRLARLELGRLPDDAVRRIVRSAAALPDPLVDEVTARAEGNAFLAEELAAVVGRRVPHALLERVADVPPPTLRSALRQAVEHHVLEPWGELGYEFRHALLAEAVSEDLLPTERLQLHRACVEALREDERLGAAADLARHALAAGDRATALHASARAGDTARRMGGPAEALGHYETALGLTDDPEVVHDLTLRAAAAANGAGRAGRAVALLRARLADAEGAPRERAELLAALAYAARLTEERVDRLTVTAEALSLLDTDAPVALRVSVLTRRADALTDAGLVEEALAVADEAMGLAVEHGLHADRVDLSSNLAWLAQAAGDPDGSVRRLQGVVEGWRDTPDLAFLRALHILAVVHHRQSDLPAALALAITVAFELGRWDHALELAERGRVGASPSARASIDAAVGYVHAARGEPDVEATLAAGRPFWPDDSRIPVQAGVAALDVLGRCGVLDRVLALRDELVTSLRAAWSVEHAPVEVRLAALVVGHLASAASTASAATRGRLLDEGERLAAAADLVWPEGSPGPELEGRMWLARLAAERLRLRRAAGEPVEAETLVTA
ncbi:AAA family ATPase [Phycicoccus jejuensis]|uniref:ATP-binding protein n=1 Tax=Phycicoccus jejuensis TaxID=367299 RepID=UPI00384AE968